MVDPNFGAGILVRVRGEDFRALIWEGILEVFADYIGLVERFCDPGGGTATKSWDEASGIELAVLVNVCYGGLLQA